MKTNHLMVPDIKGRIFCKKQDRVVQWEDGFYQDNCINCNYLAGIGGGAREDVVIECEYDDGSNNISMIVTTPEKLEVTHKPVVFIRSSK